MKRLFWLSLCIAVLSSTAHARDKATLAKRNSVVPDVSHEEAHADKSLLQGRTGSIEVEISSEKSNNNNDYGGGDGDGSNSKSSSSSKEHSIDDVSSDYNDNNNDNDNNNNNNNNYNEGDYNENDDDDNNSKDEDWSWADDDENNSDNNNNGKSSSSISKQKTNSHRKKSNNNNSNAYKSNNNGNQQHHGKNQQNNMMQEISEDFEKSKNTWTKMNQNDHQQKYGSNNNNKNYQNNNGGKYQQQNQQQHQQNQYQENEKNNNNNQYRGGNKEKKNEYQNNNNKNQYQGNEKNNNNYHINNNNNHNQYQENTHKNNNNQYRGENEEEQKNEYQDNNKNNHHNKDPYAKVMHEISDDFQKSKNTWQQMGQNEYQQKYGQSNNNNNNHQNNGGQYQNHQQQQQQQQQQNQYQGNEKHNQYQNNNQYQEKNNYNNNNNNPYASANAHSGLAEVIPNNEPKTLDDVYRKDQTDYNLPPSHTSGYNNNNGGGGQSGYGQQLHREGWMNTKQNVLLLINFGRDFNTIDPYNNNSQFRFANSKGNLPAKNAAYVTIVNGFDSNSAYAAAEPEQKKYQNNDNNNQYYRGKRDTASGSDHDEYNNNNNNNNDNNEKYQNNNNDDYNKNVQYVVYQQKKRRHSDSFVRQYTVPFVQYANNTDLYADDKKYEGHVRSKNNYTIGTTQRLLLRWKNSCKIIGADKNPFSTQCVSNAWDDPRLAACEFGIKENNGSQLNFFFAITNTAVWAVYQRDAPKTEESNGSAGDATGSGDTTNGTTAQPFIARRRVGVRPRYDSTVDAAIEIDNRQGVVNYYLNGYRVWSIYAIGVPPADDGITAISLGTGTPQITTVPIVRIFFGGTKRLDERDPNNLGRNVRLVRQLAESTYYGVNDQFCANDDLESDELWGQGIIFDLIKMLLLRSESIVQPQAAPLPGVYGPPPSAPVRVQVYQEENNNKKNTNDYV